MASTPRSTKLPSLSNDLPMSVDPDVRKRFGDLTEVVNVRLGLRGDPLDRAVTLRELIDSGLVSIVPNKSFVFGGPANFVPAVQSTKEAIPAMPTGVSANGGTSIITVVWDAARYSGHALTEVWRLDTNTIAGAILVGTATGVSYTDGVGANADYYYWVRHVSTAGTRGPFHSTSGANAVTGSTPVSQLSADYIGSLSDSTSGGLDATCSAIFGGTGGVAPYIYEFTLQNALGDPFADTTISGPDGETISSSMSSPGGGFENWVLKITDSVGTSAYVPFRITLIAAA